MCSKFLIILLIILAVILAAVIIIGISYISKDEYDILSDEFQIQVDESYEILMFEKTDNEFATNYRAKLKINENEYK